MNITINVDDVTLASVVDDIIAHDEETGEPYPSGHRTIGDLVATQIVDRAVKDTGYRSLVEQVGVIRAEMIRDAIEPGIAEAIARPIRKTNQYGEAAGGETTLTEVIVDQARKILNAPADPHAYRDSTTFLEKTVRAAVQDALGKEIADAVTAARKQVAGEIGQQVAAAVQAGLTRR